MSWITNWWNSIVQSDNQEIIDKYEPKLKAYQKQIDIQNEQITELSNNYKNATNTVQILTTEKIKLLLQIQELTTKPIAPIVTAPNIFKDNNSKTVTYFPGWLVYYFKNNKIATQKVVSTPSKFYKMWTDDMYVLFNSEIKDCKTFDEKVIKLREVVTSIVKYEFDVLANSKTGENWRLPVETYYGRIGDCEDSTTLWVTACNLCGLPSDRYFNATGMYNKLGQDIGHSWGIARFDDGKWYVIETTSNTSIKQFIGSDYRCKGIISGLSNQDFYGAPISEQF